MKITKSFRALLLALVAVMVLSLFSCTDFLIENGETEGNSQGTGNVTEAPTNGTDANEATEDGSATEDTVDTGDDTDAECKHENGTEVPAKAATCTTKGNDAYMICECGAIIGSDGKVLEAIPEYDAIGHAWVDATCTTPKTCTNCNATQGKENGHTWNAGETTTPAKCGEPGVATFTCTIEGCGATKTEAVDALDHAWATEGEITLAPTCEEKGAMIVGCTREGCTATNTVELDAAGHTWDDGKVTTEPGCGVAGEKTFECTACDATKTEEVDALAHVELAPNKEDNCNVYCGNCSALLKEGQHAEDKIDAVWSPVKGSADENGIIYEQKSCADCGQIVEKRPTAYYNCVDTIRVNGAGADLVNDKTPGCNGTKSVPLDFTYPENGWKDGKTVTSTIGIGGWFACNGSVVKYVYRINGGEWLDAVGEAADLVDTDAHIGVVDKSGLGLADYRGKVRFSGGLNTGDLHEYANQTIDVEFGAIPANNPGTAEAPNVLIMANITGVKVVCDHTMNEFTSAPNDPQNVVCEKCVVCEEENIKLSVTTSPEGLMYFGADAFAAIKGGLVTDPETGFKYVRINSTKATGEENFSLFSSTTAPITNVGAYIAILARNNSVSGNQVELFVDSTAAGAQNGGSKRFEKFGENTGWQLIVLPLSKSTRYDGAKITSIRFDQFNADNRPDGSYLDVAFLACFNTEQAAYDYYAQFVKAYLGLDACQHFTVSGEWTTTENEGEIKNTCAVCEIEVVKACEHKDCTLTATDDAFTFNSTCNVCNMVLGAVSNINAEGNYMFDAETTFDAYNKRSAKENKGFITGEFVTDDGDFDYVHFEVIAKFGGEKFFYFNDVEHMGRIPNAGAKFAIMYRASGDVCPQWDCFMNSSDSLAGPNNKVKTIKVNEEWNLVIFDADLCFNTAEGAGPIRLDMFNSLSNGAQYPVGTYVDIAYAGFFDSAESAQAFYNAYIGN